MREWIESNGLGGYASLSQSQKLTRKFHGLLIASRNPPVDRWVFVSNCIDKLQVEDTFISLQDYAQFSFNFFPTWTYTTPYGIVKKTLCMPHEQNTTVLKYDVSLSTQKQTRLLHQLHLNSRHFYDTYPQPRCFPYSYTQTKNALLFNPQNVNDQVTISCSNSRFHPVEQWIPYSYTLDCQRNDSCYDHGLYLGNMEKTVKNNQSYYLLFTAENNLPKDGEQVFSNELKRRHTLLQKAGLPENMHRLIFASDRFIVKKPPYHTILAGYHWFSDWGRDTLISLPGITLVTGRFQTAKEILQGLAKYTKQGIIPNTFDDRDSSPAYNTVDASLWYLDRVFQYIKYTNDKQFINNNYAVLQSIISAYRNGTHHHIFMDEDYLISHDPGLTWMDVKLGKYYPTPRGRKAVEIQALWYNALRIMSLFAELTDKENPYQLLAEHVKESFNQQYDALYDVIDTRDKSIRPNMIFLASLDFPMIPPLKQKQIVDLVEEKLLTIFGLRTLDSTDPQYKPTYLGEYHRDLAYHNGTVWPWLLGPFIKAKAHLHKNEPKWQSDAYKKYLQMLLHVYGDTWDGSIHEIFDAEPPFAPRGCMSQAWSVAEILRAWVEDILRIRPPYEDVISSNKIRI
ncbi:MAG: glycogen debranching enzyme family protein [Candidatus Thermoplasmatota archaeon]|nr:glycogen debranching enzyme family protein [Candidatus Thermoplasmatota archaeon]